MDLDITGKRFGKLKVIKKSKDSCKSGSKWICVCDCGNTIVVARSSLTSGHTKSCGCARISFLKSAKPSLKHGGAARNETKKCERLYKVWCGMKERCNNPNNIKYSEYGGRGIKVCDEWNDYSVFREWALKTGYDANAPRGVCTIDRINNNGNYCPSNCRWVDSHIQRINQRRKK